MMLSRKECASAIDTAHEEICELMAQIIFHDPNAIPGSSSELLNRLASRMRRILGRDEFDILLDRAAKRSGIDLSMLNFQLPLRHSNRHSENTSNSNERDREQTGPETLLLLITLFDLLSVLVGRTLSFQLFRNTVQSFSNHDS
ncbi:hypothetical protein [Massilia glaciei]|uniref:hypothetical protein n=1 Tax=Massilia glaciei TaxID=1524097 RepID=UPI0011B1E0F2|nr:hypothetical protein [Massilia glaciei]